MAFPTGWTQKFKLSVNPDFVPGDLTDFPVLIDISVVPSSAIDDGGTSALNGGGDVRISSDEAGSVQLPCEIVHFVTSSTPSSRKIEFYTKLSSVSSSSPTDFWIWYGKSGEVQPAANDTYGKYNVWDSNFIAVYHLADLTDSTSNQKTLTANGSPLNVVARVGGGNGYQSNSHSPWNLINSVNPTEYSGTNTGTLEAWAFHSNGTHENRIARTGTTSDQFVVRFNGSGGVNSNAYINANDIGLEYLESLNIWRYLALSYDGVVDETLTFYRGDDGDGTIQSLQEIGITETFGSGQDYEISVNLSSYFLDGIIDEVRFSLNSRNSDWIEASFNNQWSTSDFYGVSTPPSLEFTLQPSSHSVVKGSNTTFTATAVATPSTTVTYQWKKNGNDLSNGGNISGATTSTLSISSTGASDEATYTVVATASSVTLESDPATLTVTVPIGGGILGADSTLLVASKNNGLLIVDFSVGGPSNPTITQYTVASTSGGLPSNNLTCIDTDNDGNIWIGTLSSGFVKRDPIGDTWTSYNISNLDGLLSNSIKSIAVQKISDGCSNADTIWVGTSAGLFVFVPGDNFVGQYLSSNSIITNDTINKVRLGSTYVGTGGGGAYLISSGIPNIVGTLKVSKNSSLITDEFRIYLGQKDLQEYSEFIRALLRG